MAEQALSTAVGTAQKAETASGALSGAFMPRLITGFAILLTWELVVRAFAPAYVAKPTTVILAIPKVTTEPAFLQATLVTAGARRLATMRLRLPER